MSMTRRSCSVCRKEFRPKVWNQVTCSKRCRDKWRAGYVRPVPQGHYGSWRGMLR